MIRRTLRCVIVLGVWLMASGSLSAHHSLAGVYEMKGEKEVTGTLTIIKFVNPPGSTQGRGCHHCEIHPDAGR